MKDEQWIAEVIAASDNEFVEAVCPWLKNNACTIYQKRFSCCRNFKRPKGYCAQASCLLTGAADEDAKAVCPGCRENCCSQILIPKKSKPTKAFMKRWMDVDCETCLKFFVWN